MTDLSYDEIPFSVKGFVADKFGDSFLPNIMASFYPKFYNLKLDDDGFCGFSVCSLRGSVGVVEFVVAKGVDSWNVFELLLLKNVKFFVQQNVNIVLFPVFQCQSDSRVLEDMCFKLGFSVYNNLQVRECKFCGGCCQKTVFGLKVGSYSEI